MQVKTGDPKIVCEHSTDTRKNTVQIQGRNEVVKYETRVDRLLGLGLGFTEEWRFFLGLGLGQEDNSSVRLGLGQK